MSREARTPGGVTDGASGCQLQWMREHGLWSAADDAVIIARYGPTALEGHWFCCVAQPWRKRSATLAGQGL